MFENYSNNTHTSFTLTWVDGNFTLLTPCLPPTLPPILSPRSFSLNNSETEAMHFAAVSNFPLEIFIKAIPNLPETKHRQWYFQFPEFWSIPYKQKLNLQVTKLDKRYTKNFTITSCQQILTSLLFL